MPSYLVIGASRGLGYAWLQVLSQDAANTVVGLARTPAAVEERLAKDNIKNVHVIPGDMASHSSLAAAAELAEPLLPDGLDVLIVNGAYINPETAFLSPTAFASSSQAKILHDDIHQSLDTNVLGAVYSINAFLPLVLKGTLKKVVVISSGFADTDTAISTDGSDGVSFQVAYSAMKAALNMIVAKFASDLESKGVITLALCPGVVNTSETQPTEDLMKGVTMMFGILQKRFPKWKGPLSPIDSVKHQLKVIDNLKIEDSGKFLSHQGNKIWL